MHNRAATRQLTPVEHYDERVDVEVFVEPSISAYTWPKGEGSGVQILSGMVTVIVTTSLKRLSYSYIRDTQSLVRIPRPNLKFEQRS